MLKLPKQQQQGGDQMGGGLAVASSSTTALHHHLQSPGHESNDATMGSSTGSIASLLLEESSGRLATAATAEHPTTSPPPLPQPGTAAKRERSEGSVVDEEVVPGIPSPHGWRRTHEAAVFNQYNAPPPQQTATAFTTSDYRQPPSYVSSVAPRGVSPIACSSDVELLRKEVVLLQQSYRELQHMYGEKCGEVVVLRRRLDEATGRKSAMSFPPGSSKREGSSSLPGGGRRDIDSESMCSAAPSTATTNAARLCCELCDVHVTSERSLLYHKQGDRHRRKLAKMLMLESEGSGGGAGLAGGGGGGDTNTSP